MICNKAAKSGVSNKYKVSRVKYGSPGNYNEHTSTVLAFERSATTAWVEGVQYVSVV